MKPQSAKAKGRKLQQWVRDQILQDSPPWISPDDVRSTGMGQQGTDIQLSSAGQDYFPFATECKSLAKQAIYKHYEQAQEHAGKSLKLQPLVILRQNHSKALAVVDAEWFIKTMIDYFNGERLENNVHSGHTGKTGS